MSVSVRTLGVSGVAVVTAGVMALSPAFVAPQTDIEPLPTIHVDQVNLAGIGQDIYQSITTVVQQVVGGASYIINFTPIIGGLIAAQININYYQLIQPAIEATVNYAAAIVQNPLNFIDNTKNYGNTLFDIGYNYVSAQLQFLGLNPLSPLPPLAAANRTKATPAPAAAARAAAAVGAPVKNRATRAAAAARTANPAAARSHTVKPARAVRAAAAH